MIMLYRLVRRVSPVSIACAIALSASNNAVADTKVYPGTFCVEQNDTTPEIYYSAVNALNSSAGANWWSCPIVRDDTAVTGDVTDWDIVVHRGGNTTDTWTLTLSICDGYGSSCDFDNVTASTSFPYFNEIDGGVVDGFEAGGMTIESSVPPGCAIWNYRVNE